MTENESLFTPSEVQSAKRVHELMLMRILTSSSEMVRMIKTGSILNCIHTEQDMLRAEKIYGSDIAAL